MDNTMMSKLGLDHIPESSKNRVMAHVIGLLESRVADRMDAELSEDQLAEFQPIVDSQDAQKAATWLDENYPEHQKVVNEEIDKLSKQTSGADVETILKIT